MFGLKMLAGDTIARTVVKDSLLPVVVNETLVQSLHIRDPRQAVGQQVQADGAHLKIIGVVADFQSESKHKKRRACMLFYEPRAFYAASIRIHPLGMHETVARS